MLWNGNVDISVSFFALHHQDPSLSRGFVLDSSCHFSTLDIGLESVYLRDDETRRSWITDSVRGMFERLCAILRPVFGCSYDEGFADYMLPHWQLEREVAERRRPTIIFWLQYFDNQYFARVPRDAYAPPCFDVAPVGDAGVIVMAANRPYEVDWLRLEELNESLWR